MDETGNCNNMFQLCEECGVLPTQHKCSVCRITLVFPMCCYKRGHEDLNDRPCVNCGQNVVNSVTESSLYVAENDPTLVAPKHVGTEACEEPNQKR